MARTASSKTKLEREKEKAEKAKQKEQAAADKERAKQQKEAERAAAAATKAAKAAERARVEAERDKLRREKEEVRLERERLAVEREREKVAREKEKSEKDKEKTEREKAKKEKAQEKERLVDRSRNLLSAFLGVSHKQAATESQPTTAAAPMPDASTSMDGSSGPVAAPSSSSPSLPSTSSPSTPAAAASPPPSPQPLFHPFQLKPNSTLAPLHRLPPASPDEIDYMTQQHSPSSTCHDYPSLTPQSSASSPSPLASYHGVYMRSGDAVIARRKRARSTFYTRPSRRNKLIQHNRTFRPPYYGYLPSLPATPLSPSRPFVPQSSGVNYEVDSDEEWGEEPEGEELGEEDEEGEEDGEGAGKEGGVRGQLRRDGYEEDGDFTVPEDEDEALLMGGLMAEARVMEKGGKKRVVIRPIVVGPWHTGDAISAEVAELRRRTQWKWCRPLTREVVKRARDLEEEKAERSEAKASKAHERKADATPAPETASASSVLEYMAVEKRGAGTSTAHQQPPQQQAAGDCFTPPVKKKVKRTIVPQLTSSAPIPPPTPATTNQPVPLPSPSSSPLSQPPQSTVETKALDGAAAGAVGAVCMVVVETVVAAGGTVAMEVAEVEADSGRCVGGSELEGSELELTTELSCSEAGTGSSDMLTSELSTTE